VGVGLGDEFLAHLERARLFVHVLEAQEEIGARFRAIDRELAAYGAGLAERPQIVVLNKIDLVEETPSFPLADPRVVAVLPTSAATGEGVDDVKRALFDLIPESRTPPVDDEIADFLVYRPQPPRRRSARIFRTEGGYRVRGDVSEADLRARGIRPEDVVEAE
jgi:GTP-binding protein